jgi:hypothetical protein
VRDPDTISRIDQAIAWAKARLSERFGEIGKDYHVHYHLYGRNAVMEALENKPALQPHELGIVVEAVASDSSRCEEICALAARNLFFARLPEMRGTAGAAALMADEILTGKPAYEWTLNHVISVEHPCELFRTEYHTVE